MEIIQQAAHERCLASEQDALEARRSFEQTLAEQDGITAPGTGASATALGAWDSAAPVPQQSAATEPAEAAEQALVTTDRLPVGYRPSQ